MYFSLWEDRFYWLFDLGQLINNNNSSNTNLITLRHERNRHHRKRLSRELPLTSGL